MASPAVEMGEAQRLQFLGKVGDPWRLIIFDDVLQSQPRALARFQEAGFPGLRERPVVLNLAAGTYGSKGSGSVVVE